MATAKECGVSVVDLECPDCTDRYYAVCVAYSDGRAQIYVPEDDIPEVEAVRQVVAVHVDRDYRVVGLHDGEIETVANFCPVECQLCGTVDDALVLVEPKTLHCKVFAA